MRIMDKNVRSNCDRCVRVKMCEYTNRLPDERAKGILDLIHCDLVGQIKACSFESKCRYAVTLFCR